MAKMILFYRTPHRLMVSLYYHSSYVNSRYTTDELHATTQKWQVAGQVTCLPLPIGPLQLRCSVLFNFSSDRSATNALNLKYPVTSNF